jgi:hypothetical protein
VNLRNLREGLVDKFFGDVLEQRVQLALKVVDDKWWKQIGGAVGPQDRPWGELSLSWTDALAAWRDNPLARRIVALTTDYVVGDGIRVTSKLPEVDKWIKAWWDHPQNKISQRLYAWCDELTRSGEIFLVLSTNPGDGVSYVRAVPAVRVDRVETDPDDLERELRFHELVDGSMDGRWWPSPLTAGPGEACMVHYAINRPVGAVRGESDLTPILVWLRRYREWIEDRVRVNRLRNSFVWHVRLTNASPGDVELKRKQYKNPPSPGSIVVSDENEEWAAMTAQLQGGEASEDGKALRLLIAAGAGIPLHFLSEGESATRATASEMGGPTFRHYTHRQQALSGQLEDLVTVAIRRAAALGKVSAPEDLQLEVVVPDLARSDDQAMAQSLKGVVEGLDLMVQVGWLSDDQAAAIAKRFTGGVEDGGAGHSNGSQRRRRRPVAVQSVPGGGHDAGAGQRVDVPGGSAPA